MEDFDSICGLQDLLDTDYLNVEYAIIGGEYMMSSKTLEERIDFSDGMVAAAVVASGATGAIPLPFADMFAIGGEQVAMLVSITAVFDIEVKSLLLKKETLQLVIESA